MRHGPIVLALWSGIACAGVGGSARAQRLLTELVSVNSSGHVGDDLSYSPDVRANGRLVFFVSRADDLVPGDTNGKDDVFVRDRRTGTTECVSVDSSGVQGNNVSWGRSASADGRYVCFESYADNLVAGDTNGNWDVFVHDLRTGSTTRASVDSAGVEGNTGSLDGSVSDDGRFVAFSSGSTNLVAGDTNKCVDVFVHDSQTGVTERVSVDSSGAQANAQCGGPVISADGRHVAFWSSATNLVANDTNQDADVFVRDLQTGTTERVSVDSSGIEANGDSVGPSLSADGRFVGFSSLAGNLVSGDTNSSRDAFVHDCQTGTTERVSVDSDEIEGDRESFAPELSADGRFAVFDSYSNYLVGDDTNQAIDSFVRDRLAGTTVRVSLDANGAQGDSGGDAGSISPDGRFVAFASWSDDLAPGDDNAGIEDVFIRGPRLVLEADPTIVTAGSNLTFTTWRGEAGGVSLLAFTEINGAPVFVPALFGTFDASGFWLVQTTVPAGLAGNAITFEVFGFVTVDKVDGTHPVEITFQ